jgi:4-hydroxybenzoate polyprenyltransferase
MTEKLFFILGIVNNLFLIFIFLIREKMTLLKRIGKLYFLLAIPAVWGIFLVQQENKSVRYSIFLGIFLAFLALELLYDYVLKIPFRENLKKYWKQSVPYLALYYAMNYGFVMMIWKYYSQIGGAIMLGLLIIQIIVNIRTHLPQKKIATK